jgi:small subunit ribosomal protein S17
MTNTVPEKVVKTKTPQKRDLVGTVISIASKNTVIVEVVRSSRHPLYKKMVKRTKHFAVHSDVEGIAVGDNVKIAESRPMSKTKHFRMIGKVAR